MRTEGIPLLSMRTCWLAALCCFWWEPVYQKVFGAVFHHCFAPAPLGDGPWWQELGAQVKDAYVYGFYLFFDFAGYSLYGHGGQLLLRH